MKHICAVISLIVKKSLRKYNTNLPLAQQIFLYSMSKSHGLCDLSGFMGVQEAPNETDRTAAGDPEYAI